MHEQAILRTMHRYCRAIDYGIVDEWLDVFTSDAIFEATLPGGDLFCRLTSRNDFIQFLDEYPRPPENQGKHVVVNAIIDVDGDVAKGDSGFVYLTRGTDRLTPELVVFGRYRDRFRLENNVWRIAERVCDNEAIKVGLVESTFPDRVNEGGGP